MPTPRLSSPRGETPAAKLAAFEQMRQRGAGWGEALVSIFRGHTMTAEQAAICVQAYWRRYAAAIRLCEERGAAITVQASFRAHSVRRRVASAKRAFEFARLSQSARGEAWRAEARAAAAVQAAWRGRLARKAAAKERARSHARLKRGFSWSRRAAAPRGGRDERRGAAGGEGTPRLRRSLSFDRFVRPWHGDRERSAEALRAGGAPKWAAVSKELLRVVLQRGPAGLGLELDSTNTITKLVRGGAAEQQGLVRVGDTIACVDDFSLRGRLLQDVLDRSKASYTFDIWRLRPVEREEPRAALRPVRRAFSFERKSVSMSPPCRRNPASQPPQGTHARLAASYSNGLPPRPAHR
ncbi:hypothetical protein AB1Y20_000357 [Prymnesium parvum]|uniref:PDZ domain-containing protein n=1 Tax=Prymnesium parvum TaxID=97485 RepID=A0AB34K887_PRYPA